MKIDTLPTSYIKPKKLILGTNSLENVTAIISFNGFIPILIGEGEIPHIWLNIPANKEGTEWYPLVKDNFSTNPNVIVNENNTSIKITTPDGIVLDCKKNDNGEIIVSKLNLKPFGLNIEADTQELKAITNSFRGNKFKNMTVMFRVGA